MRGIELSSVLTVDISTCWRVLVTCSLPRDRERDLWGLARVYAGGKHHSHSGSRRRRSSGGGVTAMMMMTTAVHPLQSIAKRRHRSCTHEGQCILWQLQPSVTFLPSLPSSSTPSPPALTEAVLRRGHIGSETSRGLVVDFKPLSCTWQCGGWCHW